MEIPEFAQFSVIVWEGCKYSYVIVTDKLEFMAILCCTEYIFDRSSKCVIERKIIFMQEASFFLLMQWQKNHRKETPIGTVKFYENVVKGCRRSFNVSHWDESSQQQ